MTDHTTPHNVGPVWLSRDEYELRPGLRTSEIKRFAECPESYALRVERECSKEMQFGLDLERWLWRPEEYVADVVLIPLDVLAANGDRRGNAWKKFASQHEGKRLMKSSESAERTAAMTECTEQLLAHQAANELLGLAWQPGMRAWPSFHWHCECTGEYRKAELDLWHPGRVIVDLKTTRSVKTHDWARQAELLRYHWQAASYQDGVEACTGERLPVVFLCVKNTPPYNVEVYEMDQQWIDAGRQEVAETIERMQVARGCNRYRTETWGKIVRVQRPRWAKYAGDYIPDEEGAYDDDSISEETV